MTTIDTIQVKLFKGFATDWQLEIGRRPSLEIRKFRFHFPSVIRLRRRRVFFLEIRTGLISRRAKIHFLPSFSPITYLILNGSPFGPRITADYTVACIESKEFKEPLFPLSVLFGISKKTLDRIKGLVFDNVHCVSTTLLFQVSLFLFSSFNRYTQVI